MSLESSAAARRVLRFFRTPGFGLLFFVGVAIAIGTALRFVWLWDMEYKADEQYLFARSQRVGSTEPWPTLGMPSSAGLDNPGLSVWIFVALAKIFCVHHPVTLDRVVVACNVSAFVAFFAFVVRGLPSEERTPWLWALALAAVNPMAVLLERKIWQQSILPIFCVVFLIGWLRRERPWGSAVWGLVGSLLGQIHMGGFFFTAGFAAWELLAGRARPRKTQWEPWLDGAFLGALPLIPWIRYALGARHGLTAFDWHQVLTFRFYGLWLSDTLGLGLDYSLGGQYLDFLRFPNVFGATLYPTVYLLGLSFSIGLYIAVRAAPIVWRSMVGAAPVVWRNVRRARVVRDTLAHASEAAFACIAALVGYGLLLTASGLHVWRHYLIVTFPLEWVMLACLALAGTPRAHRFLGVLWATQLALSIVFLVYIHQHQGAPHGDYGRAFRWR